MLLENPLPKEKRLVYDDASALERQEKSRGALEVVEFMYQSPVFDNKKHKHFNVSSHAKAVPGIKMPKTEESFITFGDVYVRNLTDKGMGGKGLVDFYMFRLEFSPSYAQKKKLYGANHIVQAGG